jgi:hypothetical protein
MTGWVYILSNKAMPELLKIGQTKHDPEKRAKDLSRPTGVPHPFIVEYSAFVNDHIHTEKNAHRLLKPHRASKEFFRCDIGTAIIAIRTSVNGEILTENHKYAKDPNIEERLRKQREEELKKQADEKAAKEKIERERLALRKQQQIDAVKRLEQAAQYAKDQQLAEDKRKQDELLAIDKETIKTLSEKAIGLWGFLISSIFIVSYGFHPGALFIATMVLVINYYLRKWNKDSAIEQRKRHNLPDLQAKPEIRAKQESKPAESKNIPEESLARGCK